MYKRTAWVMLSTTNDSTGVR